MKSCLLPQVKMQIIKYNKIPLAPVSPTRNEEDVHQQLVGCAYDTKPSSDPPVHTHGLSEAALLRKLQLCRRGLTVPFVRGLNTNSTAPSKEEGQQQPSGLTSTVREAAGWHQKQHYLAPTGNQRMVQGAARPTSTPQSASEKK